MTAMLYRLARFCVRQKWLVLAAWLLLTIAVVAVSHQMGDNTSDDLSLPGTNSQLATNTLSGPFPVQSRGTSPIVLHAKNGKLTDSKYKNAVDQAAADVAKAPNVASVVNPLTPQGASALSKDQTTGYLSVGLKVSPGSLSESEVQTIINAAESRPRQPGSRCRAAGNWGSRSEAVHGVQRADRNHRRDGHPGVHLRDDHGDGAADPGGHLRARHHAFT